MFGRGKASDRVEQTDSNITAQQAAEQGSAPQHWPNNTASTVAAIRSQQQARRRTAEPAAPTLSALQNSRSTPHSPVRSRVQQAPGTAASNLADGSQGASKSLRSRLMPLAASNTNPQTSAAAASSAPGAVSTVSGFSAQLFSVFTNPLSSAGAADANSSRGAQPGQSRAAAAIPAAESPDQLRPDLQQALGQATETADAAAAAANPAAAEAHAGDPAAAEASAEAADVMQAVSTSYSPPAGAGKASMQQDGLQRTYCFEVQAAGSEPEQLIDYNGHDQHGEQFGPDGQVQQLGGSIQQYVYDEDTGQLCRTGEGAETTRLGRHYLEDCHTGEFFQLAQQPTGGLWDWIRRRPRLGADGWFRGAGAQQGDMQQQHEPGFLHSLSDFLDTTASGMAALGLFAQGLAGGLALLCLSMTYIQYATAGREAFLAFYSPQAEMVNRTFFTLISISLVAAAARHAYDQLGNFFPRHLRLGLVDSLVMLLYFLAYTCNLLATPLDDQLAFEAHRDPGFYTLPLPAAFESRLGLWHALNLVRVVACGLAWVLVCYRSNHFVMLRVFEARKAEEEEEQQRYMQMHAHQGVSGIGGIQTVPGVGAAGAADASRRLARLGSNLQGFVAADRGAAGGAGSTQQQQQQWAVMSKRFSFSGSTAAAGATAAAAAAAGPGVGGAGVGSSGGQGWASDQRR